MTSALLTLDALRVGYARRPLLPPISVEVAREQLWALVGRNGAGKTTLLRTVLGLLPKVAGAYRWGEGARVGYAPQRSDFDLSVPMRARDVVAMGLDAGFSFMRPLAHRERVERVLAEVGMEHLSESAFSALSEGQRQRVLLARALAREPDVLILDEPTNGMDLVAERAAFELFAQLGSARRLALIVVSHHMSLLAERATHVLWVDKDEGCVVAGDVATVGRDAHFTQHYGALFAALPRGAPVGAAP